MSIFRQISSNLNMFAYNIGNLTNSTNFRAKILKSHEKYSLWLFWGVWAHPATVDETHSISINSMKYYIFQQNFSILLSAQCWKDLENLVKFGPFFVFTDTLYRTLYSVTGNSAPNSAPPRTSI